jgi:hypothetical protein
MPYKDKEKKRQREKARRLKIKNENPEVLQQITKRKSELRRIKMQTDPEWAKKYLQQCSNYKANKRATDPKWVEQEKKRKNEFANNKYATNSKWVEQQQLRHKTRYHEKKADAEWVEQENKRKNEFANNKYATNSKWAEEQRIIKRDYMRHKTATDPEWVKKNRQRRNKYYNYRYENEPQFKLQVCVSAQIRQTLKRVGSIKKNKTLQILGYTSEQLKTHLEFLFTDGMTWENYGRGGWNIDHKLPISSFNFTCETDPEFQQCWSLDNLQPLWETTRIIDGVEYMGNLNKSARLI